MSRIPCFTSTPRRGAGARRCCGQCVLLIVFGLFLLAVRPAVAIDINLVIDPAEGPLEGFNDPLLGAERVAAFQYAADIWGGLLQERYAGETINVRARMDPLGGTATSAILGGAGAPFIHREFGGAAPYQPQTWYGSALANHLNGSDLLGSDDEVVAVFNSDVDDATVLGGVDWYYGLDMNPGPHIDYVTVVLHEIGHGLNFFDLIDTPTGNPPAGGTGGWPGGFPGIYDRFLMEGTPAGTPFTAMTDAERLAAVTSDDVYWSGPEGIDGNGGSPPKIHAPMMFQPGSSISHLDPIMHGAQLMSPLYTGVEHSPQSAELGMLRDMGWLVVPEPTSAVLIAIAVAGFATGSRRRCRVLPAVVV